MLDKVPAEKYCQDKMLHDEYILSVGDDFQS